MKALIIDDEVKAREILQFLMECYIPEINEIKLANGADQANKILTSFQPDLVFLDIKMPGKDGFTWLKERQNVPPVIFTTAHDQYAIQAIRFSAFDYILKPIDAEDLRKAMDRFLENRKDLQPAFDNLFYNTEQEDPGNFRLTIATTEGTHYLDPGEIVRCEADGNYTFFHMKNGKKIIASRPIGLFAELLESFGFIRCHKSHLVNARFVTKMSDLGLWINDICQVEISRRRKKEVKMKLDNYLQSNR